ncbi:MAG: cytochrome c3 family protein [candidate division Zixibacteria bacterium]|nr:cytochrome c3 family protein [candidate division Zixibacteria bacterium]
MAQIFPKWTNRLPVLVVNVVGLVAVVVIVGIWFYWSPRATDVGYRPTQPQKYSHKLHAGDLGIDCRYCHFNIEVSDQANVPATSVCMNCHKLIKPDSDTLKAVRASFASHTPLEWIRVHNLAGYVYFNHAAHLRAGVGCLSCHGNVAQMVEVTQQEPLSMGWCLDCHRHPEPSLRPTSEVTNMNWTPPADQMTIGAKLKAERNLKPPVDCSGCHR